MSVSIKHQLEYAGLWTLKSLANLLPAGLSVRVGAGVGRLIGNLWGMRRGVATRNVARAFPERSAGEVDAIVGRTFANIGRTTFEVLRFGKTDQATILSNVRSDHAEVLADAQRAGKGALLLTAHFGNWELLGAWIRALGYPLDVVVKPMRNPLSDRLYNECRAQNDIGIIYTQVGTSGIVRALKKKRFVAILADQYAGQEGVEVEFFGRKVSTPRGPAALMLRYGCPLLPGVLVRRDDGFFQVEFEGPVIYEPTGDTDRDILAITQLFTTRIENHIRRWPDQWLWTHRRWRD